MNKTITAMLVAVVAVFGMLAISNSASAAACDINNPCGNGPTIPNPVGWRHLNVGEEDCPAWFPLAGCVTPRAIGDKRHL